MQNFMDSISQRLEIWYHNSCLGCLVLDDFRTGGFKPKSMENISDEVFETLTVDMSISDVTMSEIFGVSTYAVKKRRKAIGIPRGRENINRWFYSDRGEVDIGALLTAISA